MELFTPDNMSFMLAGFGKTLVVSFFAIIFSLVFGTVLALVKSYAPRPFRWLVSAYIELFRCTPNLLWILFIYFTVKGNDVVISVKTFKTIIPALFSQCTTVIKDSSYLAGINVAEFMYCSKVVMAKTTSLNDVLLVYGFVFLLYFALNFGISLLVRAYQRRVVAA